jgi:hypothetical protein
MYEIGKGYPAGESVYLRDGVDSAGESTGERLVLCGRRCYLDSFDSHPVPAGYEEGGEWPCYESDAPEYCAECRRIIPLVTLTPAGVDYALEIVTDRAHEIATGGENALAWISARGIVNAYPEVKTAGRERIDEYPPAIHPPLYEILS